MAITPVARWLALRAPWSYDGSREKRRVVSRQRSWEDDAIQRASERRAWIRPIIGTVCGLALAAGLWGTIFLAARWVWHL